MSAGVYIASPGGADGHGGIGRMTRYLKDAWASEAADLPLRVVDTYGPGRKSYMPIWFAASLVRVACAGILGRIAVLHLNVSERGSFVRKGALVGLARLLRIPIVLHCHGADLVEDVAQSSRLRRRLIDFLFVSSARVLVLGHYWRDFVLEEFGLPVERVEILWNAVPDPGRVALQVTKRPEILFLGRLGVRKGVPELLAALSDRCLLALPWHATLAGDGPVEEYRRVAAQLGLADRVTFTGWIGEVEARQCLAASQVLVLPSHHEGLPIAILEAMSFGLPIVTTPVGAIGDAVRDGENGFLVTPNAVIPLARALARLVADPGLRRTMGTEGRRRFQRDFSLEAYVAQLRQTYASVTRGAAVPQAA